MIDNIYDRWWRSACAANVTGISWFLRWKSGLKLDGRFCGGWIPSWPTGRL